MGGTGKFGDIEEVVGGVSGARADGIFGGIEEVVGNGVASGVGNGIGFIVGFGIGPKQKPGSTFIAWNLLASGLGRNYT